MSNLECFYRVSDEWIEMKIKSLTGNQKMDDFTPWRVTIGAVEDLRDHRERIIRLEAELKIRTEPLFLLSVGAEMNLKPRNRPAYEAGYRRGWRGNEYKNPYSAAHLAMFYRFGYQHGVRDVTAAIEKAVATGKAPR